MENIKCLVTLLNIDFTTEFFSRGIELESTTMEWIYFVTLAEVMKYIVSDQLFDKMSFLTNSSLLGHADGLLSCSVLCSYTQRRRFCYNADTSSCRMTGVSHQETNLKILPGQITQVV